MSEITLLDRIKSILAEVTVTDIAEIELGSDLEIDLGIDMETDFPRVVSRIIKEFELPRDARELLEDVTTVGELVGIIREETELDKVGVSVTSLPQFKNTALLETALTHRSALNEAISQSKESNERLEFLGDAVLELATTRFLFDTLPTEQEGMLTAYRSALVKTTTLAEMARELEIGKRLYLSRGEEATGGRENPSLLADTMEAVIGALYMDQGFEAAEEFLAKHLFPKFETIKDQKLYRDAKSLLQEEVQARGFEAPVYQVVKEVGPDHHKEFTVEVVVGGESWGIGTGRSKQVAQQEAARHALSKLENYT